MLSFVCFIATPSHASDAPPAPVTVVAGIASREMPAPEPQMTEKKDKSDKAGKGDAAKKGKGQKAEPEGWHRDGFGIKKGKSKIELAGYGQGDFRHYDWKVKGDEDREHQAPEAELRRLRLGIQAEFGHLTLEASADPRDSETGSRLKDLTIGYEFSKKINLLVGHFKPPVSQDFLTSASKTDFIERALIQNIAPDRDWGAAISGDLGRIGYAIGGFAGDGAGNTERAETSGAARLSLRVLKGLSLASSYMYSTAEPDPRVGTNEPSPKGASGKSLSGFTYWNRPHVKGTRQRMGADMTYARGPLRLQAEFLQIQEERKNQGSTGQTIPDARGRGWNAAVSYVLTGEKKGSTVEPEKSIFHGGRGAVEIAARVEGLKFDDIGDPSGFAGYGNRARNIAPSGGTAIEAGLNYWASNFLKFQAGGLWESYNDPLIAPVPGKTGRYFTLLGRVQVVIP